MLAIKSGIVQDTSINGVPFSAMIIKPITKKHRPMIPMKPRYTVYHDTGNTSKGSTAVAHQSLLQNYEHKPVPSQVGWHFVVDDKEIIQCIPINEIAYCQGDGGGIGNSFGISVEQCINSDGDTAKAEENACKLHGALIKTLGVTLKKHQDFSGKNCPQVILNAKRWPEVVDKVNKYANLPTLSNYTGESTKGIESPILAPPTTNPDQMRQYAIDNNGAQWFIDNAENFYKISVAYGVDPTIAYAQSAKETAFGRFGGVLDESFFNTAGIKTKEGGSNTDPKAHHRFKNWVEGITAQVQHLALYAGADTSTVEVVDPRHFSWIKGKAATALSLSNNWAGAEYGPDLERRVEKLRNTAPAKKLDGTMKHKYSVYAFGQADVGDALAIVARIPGAIYFDRSITSFDMLGSADFIQVGGTKGDGVTIHLGGADRLETSELVRQWINATQ